MKNPLFFGIVGTVMLFIGSSARADVVPLTFSTFTPPTDATSPSSLGLGPAYVGGLTMDFTNVATDGATTLDARVTAVVQANTGFATVNPKTGHGYIPDYISTTTSEPEADLGFLYNGIAIGTSGVTFTIDFYDGTGTLTGTFATPYTIPDLELLIYDVDGEGFPSGSPRQSEFFDAFLADGLYSYQIDASHPMTVTPITGGFNFLGPGVDKPETDTEGAAILRYMNTDSVSLAFGSQQILVTDNFVFSAIDGDLSLLGGDRSSFGDPTVVPVPAAVLLGILGLGVAGIKARDRGIPLNCGDHKM